jgi:hypothetical protein
MIVINMEEFQFLKFLVIFCIRLSQKLEACLVPMPFVYQIFVVLPWNKNISISRDLSFSNRSHYCAPTDGGATGDVGS